MLTTKLNSEEKYNYFDPKFKKAFDWLKSTDLTKLEKGIHPIEGDEIFASVQEYDSMNAKECKYEAHRKYFDIQYVVKGEEYFGYVKLSEVAPCGSYDEKNDLQFFFDPKEEGRILLKEGDFAIVSPEDAHKPRILVNTPQYVKKIVVKVKI